MKNFKLKILLTGILGITIISIILALTLNCQKYGFFIALFDMGSISMWLLVGNYIVDSYLKTRNNE